MQPTPQQQDIVDASRTYPLVIVQAGAGSGKTSTCRFVASAMADRGIAGVYTTLNRNVAQDVGSQFDRGNVLSGTMHSLAHDIGSVTPGIRDVIHRLEPGASPLQPFHLGAYMGITGGFHYETQRSRLNVEMGFAAVPSMRTPDQVAGDAMTTIRKWCQSADSDIDVSHVVRPADMGEPIFDNEYAPMVAHLARRAWFEDILSPNGMLPFTHDHYLKMVSVAAPSFTRHLGLPPGSAIFFDEAQDARPSMLSLIRAQADMQLIAVGDSAQSIYGFTGAHDALPALSSLPGSITLPLTMSWRFGPAIAELANDVLDLLDADIRLDGNPAVNSDIQFYSREEGEHPVADTVIVRDNKSLLEEARREMTRGFKVHVVFEAEGSRDVLVDVAEIVRGRPGGRAPALVGINTVEELAQAIELGSDSPDLQLASVALRTDPVHMIDVFDNQVPAEEADVTIITAHKSKGRQWGSVRLAMDPRHIVPGKTYRNKTVTRNNELTKETVENLRLLYVAVTRARNTLYMPQETWDSYTTMRTNAQRVLSGASVGAFFLP